ncbi:MAG: IS3 family transposase [Chloroflexota bacterium]
MAGKKRAFSPEFKQNAVQLVLNGKKPRSQIARELGVRSDLLFRWQKALAPKTTVAFEAENTSSAERRIRELERENATLREEREILKKAAAFFAKENR